MIAKDYARALFEIEKPSVVRLRAALERKGHLKLMPRIFAEYQKLALSKERSVARAEVSPEQERTRVLLQLYKKLTANAQ